MCRTQWYCLIFLFSTGKPLLGNGGPKNRNCQFKLKFGTYTNLNIHDSMVMFTYFSLYLFLQILFEQSIRHFDFM